MTRFELFGEYIRAPIAVAYSDRPLDKWDFSTCRAVAVSLESGESYPTRAEFCQLLDEHTRLGAEHKKLREELD